MNVFDEDIVALFFDVGRLNRSYTERVYGSNHPFKGQYHCLFILEATGTINQKELAQLLYVRPTSVSEILVKLEQKNWIKRTQSPLDRRISLVSLTDEGREEVSKIRKVRAKAHSDMLSNLTEEEKQHLYTALQKMKDFYLSKKEDQTEND